MQILTSTLRAMRHLAAGDKDPRYYLRGVCVEVRNDRGFLVATDGAILGVHSIPVDPNAPVCEFIIPGHMLAQVKAPSSRGAPSVVDVTLVDGVVTLQIGPVTIRDKAVDGKFPDWRRVMPKGASDERHHFNPDLLARFADVGRDLFGKATKQCPLFWPSVGGCALVNFEGYDEFRGVVMPRFYKPGEHPARPSVERFTLTRAMAEA